MKRKTKKILSSGIAIVLTAALAIMMTPAAAFAYSPWEEEVIAGSGQTTDTVLGGIDSEKNALLVDASDGGHAYATVNGDISAGNDAVAVTSSGEDSEAGAYVDGSTWGGTNGVTVLAQEGGQASLETTGEIQTDGNYALSVFSDGQDAIGSATTENLTSPYGFQASAEDKAHTSLELGNVTVTGNDEPTSEEFGQSNHIIAAGGASSVSGVIGDVVSALNGLNIKALDGTVYLQTGDITSDGLGINMSNANGAALVESGSIVSGGAGVHSLQDGAGISVVQVLGDVVSTGDYDSGHEYVNNGATLINDGLTVFAVNGSVISEQANGMTIYNSEEGRVIAVVDDTISGAENGVVVADFNEENGIELTVWKIKAGEGEIINEFGDAETFAPNVRYIVKLEQPEVGGTISATDAEGNALEHYVPFGIVGGEGAEGVEDGGYDVAYEGDKVLLKVNLEEGYRIVGAYNGKDEKVALLFDGENYYVVVPRGGGIYLSVELSNEYDVTFTDENGKVLQSGKVEYGTTPAYKGATPTKAEDENYTYEFIGWTPELDKVTGDMVYKPLFKAIEKKKDDPEKDNDKEEVKEAVYSTPKAALPQTGDSAPIAGLIILVALSGAVVCVANRRMNR